MLAPQRRDRRTVKTDSARTGGGFCTYADRNEAPAYRTLAAKAREAGYRVSASQVRRWVMDGLLPSPGRRVSLGRRGFQTEPNDDAERQLLALCEYRTLTKSWDRLAILLWAYAWNVSTERYRRAAFAELPQLPDPNTLWDPQPKPLERDPASLSDEELDKYDQAAASRAQTYRAFLQPADRRSAADVTSAVFSMALGTAEATTPAVAEALDRAAVAVVTTGSPEVPHDIVAELDLFRKSFSIEKIRERLEQATSDELEASRGLVRVLSALVPSDAPIVAVMLAMLAEDLGLDWLGDAAST